MSLAVSILCGSHATALLVKAAAVAVTAPPDPWPVLPPPSDPSGRIVVGLVFMYVSIGAVP
jgi:hypothetical protein